MKVHGSTDVSMDELKKVGLERCRETGTVQCHAHSVLRLSFAPRLMPVHLMSLILTVKTNVPQTEARKGGNCWIQHFGVFIHFYKNFTFLQEQALWKPCCGHLESICIQHLRNPNSFWPWLWIYDYIHFGKLVLVDCWPLPCYGSLALWKLLLGGCRLWHKCFFSNCLPAPLWIPLP